MKRIFFTAILVTAFAVSISAQDNQKAVKTNLEIFDKNISGGLEKFFYIPQVNRNNPFVFDVTVDNGSDQKLKGAKEFITGLVKKTAAKNDLNFSIVKDSSGSFDPDSSYNWFGVSIVRIGTKYPKFARNKFLGEKTVQRKLQASIGISVHTFDGKTQVNDMIYVDYTDTVDYDNIEQLETEEYAFTKARPPEVNLIEAVFFPVAIVLISAAATVLFFTIRTK